MRSILIFSWFILIHTCLCYGQNEDFKTPQTIKTLLPKSNPDTTHLNLLLQISKSYLSNKDKRPTDIDSALLYAHQAESFSQSLKNIRKEGFAYLLLAQIFNEKKDIVHSRVYAQKAIDYFTKFGPKKELAEGYITMSKNFESYDTGILIKTHLCEKAIEIFHKENDKENEANTLKELGWLFMLQGRMDEALGKLQQSLSIYRAIGYKPVQEIYSWIGVIYTQVGNYNEGLNYGLQAVRIVEQLNDTSQTAGEIYDYLAITYYKLNNYYKNGEYLRKALAIAARVNDTNLVILLSNNIASGLLLQNKPNEGLSFMQDVVKKYPNPKDLFSRLQISTHFLSIYLKLKDHNNATIYANKVIAISAKFPELSPDQTGIYPLIIRYFFEIGQFEKARKYLEPYKEISENSHLIDELQEVHLWWFILDSARGNYLSAIEHYKLSKMYHDSLFNENKSKQIAQLQIQYETEKKDANIQLLTKQGLLQQTQIKNAQMSRNITIGGILVLVLLMGLGYNRYRLKQRINYQLKTQQDEINQKNETLNHLLEEKEWLIKEIHHRVKNNLQIIMSLLNSQSLFLDNEGAINAIRESQHRMQAMSLIHQKLYQSENIASVEMESYVHELIFYLVEGTDVGKRIRFEQNVERIELDVTQAVPVGLILNEAITNVIKYAFPGDNTGSVFVGMKRIPNDRISLTIMDNGVGLPGNLDAFKMKSLGMNLMKGLANQLGGIFAFKNGEGLKIEVDFPYVTSTKIV